ncbi:hypothetical protein H6F43_09855, partial [Leptolyngbya sp. FACHB-36]|nr:hypothetical protein [Leptolyngbya sp. FACHB-36]
MRQNAQVVNVLLSAVLATAGSLFAPIVRPLAAQLPPTPPSSEPAPTLPNMGTPAPIYPSCPPPSGGEYLLLVVSKTPDVQERVRRSLPPSASPILCNYLSDVVTRVGGFTTVDSASAWAKYLTDTAGLSAFVARPSDAPPPISAAPPQ